MRRQTPEQSNTPAILVIEHEGPIRAILCRYLRRSGYWVLEAENGATGIKLCFHRRPGLVICDTQLPEINGFELCERMKADKAAADIPVLHIAPGDDKKNRLQSERSGAEDLLGKPFKKTDLLEKVRKLYPYGEGKNHFDGTDRDDRPLNLVSGSDSISESLEDALADVYEQVAILYDLGPVLHTTENESDLLRLVVKRAAMAIGAQSGLVALQAAEPSPKGTMSIRAACGPDSSRWLNQSIPHGNNTIRLAYHERSAWLLSDWKASKHYENIEPAPWDGNHLLIAPIQNAKTIMGILLFSRNNQTPFSSANLELLKAFASHLFFALENIRFLAAVKNTQTLVDEKVKERTREIEKSRSVVSKLNDILEVKLFELTCLKELQTAVASLFDPLEIFREAMGILDKTLGIHGSALALPEREMFMMCGTKEASGAFWSELLSQIQETLAVENFKDTSTWPVKSAGYYSKPGVEEKETGFLNQPVYIQNRFILVLTVGRLDWREHKKDEINLLRNFAHQLALYMDGAMLFMKTKELDQLKSEFISVASHELRTPMASIKSALSLLADESLGALNQDQSEFVALLERNVNRLASLINDVLDFSRIESGRLQLNLTESDIGLMFADVSRTLDSAAKEKGDGIRIELPSEPLKARCDGDKISQVLINLASNAINHNDRGITVTLGAKLSGDEIAVEVKDDGKGIPGNEHERIFERFYQVHSNQGGGGKKGTGLGLAISRGLVEAHGSKLLLDSDTDQGARFYFTLESADGPKWERGRSHTWQLDGLEVKAEQYRDRVRLTLTGEFMEQGCAAMAEIGKILLSEWGNAFVLDLGQLKYIVSRGIGSLMELRSKALKSGGGMCIISIHSDLKNIFEAMGILKIIPFHSDLNTALREVGFRPAH